jgi:hypothetical protein
MTLHVALIAFSRCVRQGWPGGWLPFLFVVVWPPSAIQMSRYKVRDFLRRIGRVQDNGPKENKCSRDTGTLFRSSCMADLAATGCTSHSNGHLLSIGLVYSIRNTRVAAVNAETKGREGKKSPKTHNNEMWATSHAASGHLVYTSILLAAHSSSEIYSMRFLSSSGRCSFSQITRNGNKAAPNKRLNLIRQPDRELQVSGISDRRSPEMKINRSFKSLAIQ